MPTRGRIAAFLAVCVLTYSSLASFLECGMHRASHLGSAGSVTHHEHGNHSHHSEHDHAGSGNMPEGSAGACCHSTLFNIVFQSLSPLEISHSESRAPAPLTHWSLASQGGTLVVSRAVGSATGPPARLASAFSPFPSRARFIALSSLLV